MLLGLVRMASGRYGNKGGPRSIQVTKNASVASLDVRLRGVVRMVYSIMNAL